MRRTLQRRNGLMEWVRGGESYSRTRGQCKLVKTKATNMLGMLTKGEKFSSLPAGRGAIGTSVLGKSKKCGFHPGELLKNVQQRVETVIWQRKSGGPS